MDKSSLDSMWGGLVAMAAGAGVYFLGWRGMRRRWAIQNMPTSRVRSVAMGTAELIGKARGIEVPLTSPVSRIPCVWYNVIVTRETGSGKNRHVETVFRQKVEVPFDLEDVTGRIRVIPDGAEVTGIETCDFHVSAWTGVTGDIKAFCDRIGITGRSGHHIREWVVMADADVYVLGEVARTSDTAADRLKRVGAMLQGWLKSPDRKAAIDADRDGRIDQAEWEAARGQAQAEVLKEEAAVPAGPAIVVRKPRLGYYIIASGGEKAALEAQGYPAVFVTAGILLVGFGVWLLKDVGSVHAALWGAAAVIAVVGGWGILRHFRS